MRNILPSNLETKPYHMNGRLEYSISQLSAESASLRGDIAHVLEDAQVAVDSSSAGILPPFQLLQQGIFQRLARKLPLLCMSFALSKSHQRNSLARLSKIVSVCHEDHTASRLVSYS